MTESVETAYEPRDREDRTHAGRVVGAASSEQNAFAFDPSPRQSKREALISAQDSTSPSTNPWIQCKKQFRVTAKTPMLCPQSTPTDQWNSDDMASPTPTTIKKYANRRLYNTASSTYVTLADLAKMVKSGDDFVVYDAKTNEDITRSVLTQIIFEQEGIEGQSLLPTTFLRQLIRFYGDSVQALLPSYLEFSIDRFTGEKQAISDAAGRIFGTGAFAPSSFNALQELTKQNLAAFHQALGIFSPFATAVRVGESRPVEDSAGKDLDKLRTQLSEIQKQLDSLASVKKG